MINKGITECAAVLKWARHSHSDEEAEDNEGSVRSGERGQEATEDNQANTK